MDRDTYKLLMDRLEQLENKEVAREKKEIIREWLYTKCIWVWTILLGWCFYAGVFLVGHYDKVAIAVMGAIKALKGASE